MVSRVCEGEDSVMKDRNYYRMLDDEDLIDIARGSDNELAIVLAERLAKASEQLTDNNN